MKPICVLLLLSLAALAWAGKITLVANGKPTAVIILAEQPTENARVAAEELQRYLEKISGAKLLILSESMNMRLQVEGVDHPAEIYVGHSGCVDNLRGLDIPAGISKNLHEEGYVLYGKGDRLVLAGNDTLPYYGTRYAVYDFLTRLGVRWYLPGDYGEVVPKMTTIAVDELKVIERPDFSARTFWTHSRGTMAEERQLWMIRNRLNPRSADWLGMPGDSSVNAFMPKDKIKDYPEWFALRPDGSRDTNLPCMADDLRRDDPKYAGKPRIIDHFIDKVKADAKVGKRSSAMAPDDGWPVCTCELCRKLCPFPDDSMSEAWFHFVNGVLEEVNKEYPDHLIATNGYSNRVAPPELPNFNPHKNLVVMFADIGACTIHAYDDPKCYQMRQQLDMLKRWCRLSDKVWIYNYNYTMLVGKSTIVPTERRVARNLPVLHRIGVLGFSDQDDADMSLTGIPTYVVRNVLEWDTSANVPALLDDFYTRWYGSAAVPMKAFYTALDDAFENAPYHAHEDPILPVIYAPALMETLSTALTAAEKAARTDTEKLHVRADRLIYDHLREYVAAEAAKREGHYAEAAKRMEHMLALKVEMNTITPFFGYRPYPVYCEDWEAKRMQSIDAKVNGTEGELLTMLPLQARFHTDPYDLGVTARWMAPELDDDAWSRISTATGWQNQGLADETGRPLMTADGHAYSGVGWYRFEVTLPRSAQGKQVHLFCPALINQVWVWVNDDYVDRSRSMSPWFRPQEVDMDITRFIKPGKNQLTLRVLCRDDHFGANGIFERPFLYVKK